MRITKDPLDDEPTDSSAAQAVSWAKWQSRVDGIRPEQGTFEH
ncbi:hypothetical protein [Nocardia panacis]|nr:hypothetical protein [Nocardia panacis]